MKLTLCVLAASACTFTSALAQNTCINLANNSVVNFGSIGNYVGGNIGSGNTLQLGHNVTCSPIQNSLQANAAIQKSYQSGIPFSIGLLAITDTDNGNAAAQGNLANLQFACGVDDTANTLIQSNFFTNQFNAQACQGSVSDLVNLPVWLGPILFP
jgi:hypothetical protein